MLGETSAGEFKLLRIRELDNDDVDVLESSCRPIATDNTCKLVTMIH